MAQKANAAKAAAASRRRVQEWIQTQVFSRNGNGTLIPPVHDHAIIGKFRVFCFHIRWIEI